MDSPTQHGASISDRLNENSNSEIGALHEALNYVTERMQNRAIE